MCQNIGESTDRSQTKLNSLDLEVLLNFYLEANKNLKQGTFYTLKLTDLIS